MQRSNPVENVLSTGLAAPVEDRASADGAAEGRSPSSSEMAERIRAFDWSKTVLGPQESWSPALHTTLKILLANRFPHILWWGPEFIQFYNDPYIPVPGNKHPTMALGRPGRECWAEIWDVIGPLITRSFKGGPAAWDEDILLEIRRRGFVEESHFTIAYSPVPDDTAPGGIGGVLGTVHEITEQIIGERRLVLLRDLGARTGDAKTAAEACAIAAQTLAAHDRDMPFALLYLIEKHGRSAKLVGTGGVTAGEDIAPAVVDLTREADGGWPMFEAFNRKRLEVVEDLDRRFVSVPPGPWKDPPRTGVVIPVPANKAHETAALLLAGVSARLNFDTRYRDFLNLVKTQIATAIANARAYEEEKRRAEELAALDRAKTVFVSNISHEFRTPLTLILGSVEEILGRRDAGATAPVIDSLRVVNRNAMRLLRLVNALLDFSRIEAGGVQPNFEPTDLAAFTQDLASAFRSLVESAGMSLKVRCDPLGEVAYVDRAMWEKIVLNLLSNAYKFTFEGKIGVTLRRADDRIELTVSDTGVGIAADEVSRIFERFHRVESSRSRSYEGSGIGLALVSELVRMHGGRITVDSHPNAGSRFTVSIPAGRAHLPPDRIASARGYNSAGAAPFVEEARRWGESSVDGDSAPLESAAIPETAATAAEFSETHRGARIILADDNADMRDYIQRLLGTYFEVQAVRDGVKALQAARARTPDLVITDVMMPNLDGFGLLAALRQEESLKAVPVIVLSARAAEESRIEGLQRGADDYLVKPFSARELLARVASTLDTARIRRDAERQIAEDLEAMTRLHETANLCVRSDQRFEECLHEILAAAIALTKADKGNLRLLERDSGALRIAVQIGFEKPFFENFGEPNRNDICARDRAAELGERVVFEDLTRSENVDARPWLKTLLDAGVRALQSTPLLSSGGRVVGILSTCYAAPCRPTDRQLRFMDVLARQAADYVEHKLDEARIRENETRLTLATEGAGMGWWDIDWRSKRTLWSRSLFQMLGLDPDSNSASMGLWRQRVHPEDLAPVVEAINHARRQNRSFQREHRIIRADNGEVTWVTVNGRFFYDEKIGKPIRFAGVYFDSTEKRRAEAALRESEDLLAGQRDALEMAIGGASLDEILGVLVRTAQKNQGHDARTAVYLLDERGSRLKLRAGAGLTDAFRSAAAALDVAPLHPSGLAVLSGQRVVMRDLDHDPRWAASASFSREHSIMACCSIPIRSTRGKMLGAMSVYYGSPYDLRARDMDSLMLLAHTAAIIIERHNISEERELLLARESQARREAEEANRTKDEFLAMLGHELRNPLAPILTALQLMQLRKGESTERERTVIERQVHHLTRLVDDLLDISKVTRGKISLKLAPVNVADIVAQAIEVASPLVEERMHYLSVSVPASGLVVQGDKARLVQAVSNLLTNAAKYSRPRGHIAIEAKRIGKEIELSVRDDGIGMSSDMVENAFEPFYQGAQRPDRAGGGLGLGLTIVKNLVKLHGGSVRASSEGKDRGSEFVIRLPAADAGADTGGRVRADAEREPARDVMTRVLVVDDNRDAAELLVEALRAVGHRADAVFDPLAALQVISRSAPDIILLDIGLPVMDGYELAEKIRQMPEGSGVRLFALTGYGQAADRKRSMDSGFEHHLSKPVDLVRLDQLIRKRPG